VLELSAGETRYLLAAHAATPLHWFRSRVVGRRAEIPAQEVDESVLSLLHAGLIEADSQHCARLTDLGRSTVAELLQRDGGTQEHPARRSWLLGVLALGLALGAAGLWWLL
jgi:hypothetical protein